MSAVKFTDDVCYQALSHSRNADDSSNNTAAQIAQILDSGLQHRDYTMGGGYQRDTTSKILALSDHPHFISLAERHALSSAIDAEMSAEMLLQLDLIQAAGSMTKDLKETIAEISAKAETLSESQKLKFVEVVFNTYQLYQANEGRIALPTVQIEKLANDTLEIMRELAIDVVLPPSLKTVSLDIIKTTASTFQLPELSAAIETFEKDTSPTIILEQTVDTLKETLLVLLGQDDLNDEARNEIEEILERLNELEDGEPIPRDILKSLDEIATQIIEINSSPALAAIAETLTKNIEAVREANIPVKAEKFNLSIDQVRAIESTMDRLEALGEELPKDEVTLKDMIAETILTLDTEPVSIKAMAKLEAVTDELQDPKFKVLEQTSPILAVLAAPIVTSSKFVQKFLTDGVAKKFNIPKESVKNFVNLYKTIDTQNRSLPATSPLKQIILSTLNSLNKTPTSLKTFAKLDAITDKLQNPKFKASAQASTFLAAPIITSSRLVQKIIKSVIAAPLAIIFKAHVSTPQKPSSPPFVVAPTAEKSDAKITKPKPVEDPIVTFKVPPVDAPVIKSIPDEIINLNPDDKDGLKPTNPIEPDVIHPRNPDIDNIDTIITGEDPYIEPDFDSPEVIDDTVVDLKEAPPIIVDETPVDIEKDPPEIDTSEIDDEIVEPEPEPEPEPEEDTIVEEKDKSFDDPDTSTPENDAVVTSDENTTSTEPLFPPEQAITPEKIKELTPENLANLTKEDYKNLTPEQEKALKEVQFGPEDEIDFKPDCGGCDGCAPEFKIVSKPDGPPASETPQPAPPAPTSKKRASFKKPKP